MQKINCPTCGKMCQLENYINNIFLGRINSEICVDFLSYHCDICSENWTTTETDEINSNEIEKGIREFKRKNKRKNKIKNILNEKTLN